MVLIEATTISTSVCNVNRWRTHFARTNYMIIDKQHPGMEHMELQDARVAGNIIMDLGVTAMGVTVDM